MCGIVGLFLKDKTLEPHLGEMLTEMLVTMTDRGPDSAGIAIYGNEHDTQKKLTVQSDNGAEDFATLAADLGAVIGADVSLNRKDTHAVLNIPSNSIDAARTALR